MTDQTFRRRIAHAIHRYDNHHALSGNDIPSKHHLGEADAVLAEMKPELDRLAEYDATPAAVPVPPPADQTALRDRIRRVLCVRDGQGALWGTDMLEPDEYGADADAVMAVLPEQTDRAAEALAAIRPQTLTALASHIDARAVAILRPDSQTYAEWQTMAALLRRVAAEEQPAETRARRLLTPGEYDAAWHAVEGAAGDEGADPGTILHAVLNRLGIDADDAPAVGEQPETQETPRPHTLLGAAELEEKLELTPRQGALHCVCGDPIEWWTGPNDSAGWIHSPGSNPPFLDIHKPRPATDPQP